MLKSSASVGASDPLHQPGCKFSAQGPSRKRQKSSHSIQRLAKRAFVDPWAFPVIHLDELTIEVVVQSRSTAAETNGCNHHPNPTSNNLNLAKKEAQSCNDHPKVLHVSPTKLQRTVSVSGEKLKVSTLKSDIVQEDDCEKDTGQEVSRSPTRSFDTNLIPDGSKNLPHGPLRENSNTTDRNISALVTTHFPGQDNCHVSSSYVVRTMKNDSCVKSSPILTVEEPAVHDLFSLQPNPAKTLVETSVAEDLRLHRGNSLSKDALRTKFVTSGAPKSTAMVVPIAKVPTQAIAAVRPQPASQYYILPQDQSLSVVQPSSFSMTDALTSYTFVPNVVQTPSSHFVDGGASQLQWCIPGQDSLVFVNGNNLMSEAIQICNPVNGSGLMHPVNNVPIMQPITLMPSSLPVPQHQQISFAPIVQQPGFRQAGPHNLLPRTSESCSSLPSPSRAPSSCSGAALAPSHAACVGQLKNERSSLGNFFSHNLYPKSKTEIKQPEHKHIDFSTSCFRTELGQIREFPSKQLSISAVKDWASVYSQTGSPVSIEQNEFWNVEHVGSRSKDFEPENDLKMTALENNSEISPEMIEASNSLTEETKIIHMAGCVKDLIRNILRYFPFIVEGNNIDGERYRKNGFRIMEKFCNGRVQGHTGSDVFRKFQKHFSSVVSFLHERSTRAELQFESMADFHPVYSPLLIPELFSWLMARGYLFCSEIPSFRPSFFRETRRKLRSKFQHFIADRHGTKDEFIVNSQFPAKCPHHSNSYAIFPCKCQTMNNILDHSRTSSVASTDVSPEVPITIGPTFSVAKTTLVGPLEHSPLNDLKATENFQQQTPETQVYIGESSTASPHEAPLCINSPESRHLSEDNTVLLDPPPKDLSTFNPNDIFSDFVDNSFTGIVKAFECISSLVPSVGTKHSISPISLFKESPSEDAPAQSLGSNTENAPDLSVLRCSDLACLLHAGFCSISSRRSSVKKLKCSLTDSRGATSMPQKAPFHRRVSQNVVPQFSKRFKQNEAYGYRDRFPGAVEMKSKSREKLRKTLSDIDSLRHTATKSSNTSLIPYFEFRNKMSENAMMSRRLEVGMQEVSPAQRGPLTLPGMHHRTSVQLSHLPHCKISNNDGIFKTTVGSTSPMSLSSDATSATTCHFSDDDDMEDSVIVELPNDEDAYQELRDCGYDVQKPSTSYISSQQINKSLTFTHKIFRVTGKSPNSLKKKRLEKVKLKRALLKKSRKPRIFRNVAQRAVDDIISARQPEEMPSHIIVSVQGKLFMYGEQEARPDFHVSRLESALT
ncbi:uncharacterized protein LOC108670882 [Hyalella azteca]|uniref:Uncharacterized protein LOC108670882 n=1 Tax=Hyalella azteca TaxID=294128 RepID=A0A8B7NKQ5_HYAAZ|nr:uncharacterized protein LOC108670882 [Hyalella azteca]